MKGIRTCFTLLLTLMLLFGSAAQAQGVDSALSGWLEGETGARFSAKVELSACLPYGEETIALLNGVLSHALVEADVRGTGTDSSLALKLSLGENELMTLGEREQEGRYETSLSLLEGQLLTSEKASPMLLLTGESEEENTPPFSLLTALETADAALTALIQKARPMMETKSANYNIKSIGKATVSNIVRLTDEQAQQLAPEMRAALACGLDADTRALLDTMTFDKQFVLALYQNKDGENMALYMKGKTRDAQDNAYTLSYQWAMLRESGSGSDTYKLELVKSGKPAASRVISAKRSQTTRADRFSLDASATVTYKLDGATNAFDSEIKLEGEGAQGARTLAGTISLEHKASEGDDDVKTLLTLTPDLRQTGAGLEGTARFEKTLDKKTQLDLTVTLSPDVDAALAQDDLYTVGTESVGTRLSLDGMDAAKRGALLQKAAQTLAPKLLMAAFSLPESDNGLLRDGMRDEDYEKVLSLLNGNQ